jgi:hypothetical protein
MQSLFIYDNAGMLDFFSLKTLENQIHPALVLKEKNQPWIPGESC